MSGQAASSRRAGVPAVGEVIAQKYRVEGVVGAGGMGVVVSARHLQLGQTVAIKLLSLPPDEDRRDEAIGRFLHEAQAAAKLQGDHVVRIYDVGQLDNGLPFMVMELLVGTDLGSLLDKQGVLSEPQAIDYVLQACAGVAEAHRMGIVHRDLKPSNLFVTQRSDGLALVKVLDFGISKQLTDPASGEAVPTFTNTRTLMGSPNYMSPEQIRDARRVDARTDVWSLGIILQELITDAPVFRGESFPGVCAAIVADPPMPVRTMRPDVSVGLEGVIDRCLQKDPQLRFQSISQLVAALSQLGTRASLASSNPRPVLYSSQPRIINASSGSPVPTSQHLDTATVSMVPGDGRTLESARLAGATRTALSPDSRIEVISTLNPRARRRSKQAVWLALGGLSLALALGAAWLFGRPSELSPSAAASAASLSPPLVIASAPALATPPLAAPTATAAQEQHAPPAALPAPAAVSNRALSPPLAKRPRSAPPPKRPSKPLPPPSDIRLER